MPGSLQRHVCEGPEEKPLWPLHSSSSLGTQDRDQLSPLRAGLGALLSVSSQKHLPGDCEAHKAVLLGDLQTDYKFTGDNQGI